MIYKNKSRFNAKHKIDDNNDKKLKKKKIIILIKKLIDEDKTL